MLGIFRYYWGIDIDLNVFNNCYFEEGKGQKIYVWFIVNVFVFGFCQFYFFKGFECFNGYNEEKWYWFYFFVVQLFIVLAWVEFQDGMIFGFEGLIIVIDIQVVDNYVLGISDLCMEK